MRTVSYRKDTSSLAGAEDYYQKSQGIFRKSLMNQSRQTFTPEMTEMKCHQEGNHNKQLPKKCKKIAEGLVPFLSEGGLPSPGGK